MIKILFAYRFCGLGGVETSVLNRCEALRRCGVEPTVVFGEFYGTGALGFTDLPQVHVGLNSTELELLLHRRFDVVCIIDYPEFVPLAARLRPQPLLLLETHTAHTAPLGEFYRMSSDQAVSAVVVPSAYNRDQVLRVSDAPRIRVIPNGVDTGRFRARSSPALGMRFGALMRKKVLLWIGRLEDEKNPQGFLALSLELCNIEPDLHFMCIGDAPQDAHYRDRLKGSLPPDMRPAFTFLPAVPHIDMPLYYSLAAATGGCLVSTSRFESVPMTFLEAMACGCPVSSTRVGGVTEILEDEVSGALFEVDDQGEAVRSVLRLIAKENRPHRARVVASALARVRERHSLDIVAERFITMLEEFSA